MRDLLNSFKLVLAVFESIFCRRTILVFERALTDAGLELDACLQVNVRIVQGDDFLKFAKRFKKFKISLSKAKERFEMGHICIVAQMDGDLVHSKWVALNKAYSGGLERKVRINFDSAFIYSSYTVPEYKGLGIAPKAMGKAFIYLYKRGIKKVYTSTHHKNYSALRALDKERFRKIGAITYTRIFNLRRYQCEGKTEEDYSKLKKLFFLS